MQQSQNLDITLDISFFLHTSVHSIRKSYWQKLMHLDLHRPCKDWELWRVLGGQRRPGHTGEANSGNKLPAKISEDKDLNL